MTKKTILSISFLLITATCSFSAEWKSYFKNANGSISYIDIKSINKLKNGNVRAWTKYENEAKTGGTLTLIEINCNERTYTIRAMEPIDRNDLEAAKALEANVKLWSEPTQDWQYIGTSDLAEKQFDAFCNN